MTEKTELDRLRALNAQLEKEKEDVQKNRDFWMTVASGNARAFNNLESLNAQLLEALKRIVRMNRDYAREKWGDADKCESYSCVQVARAAIALQDKDWK